jgi:hypothetical protein
MIDTGTKAAVVSLAAAHAGLGDPESVVIRKADLAASISRRTVRPSRYMNSKFASEISIQGA